MVLFSSRSTSYELVHAEQLNVISAIYILQVFSAGRVSVLNRESVDPSMVHHFRHNQILGVLIPHHAYLET